MMHIKTVRCKLLLGLHNSCKFSPLLPNPLLEVPNKRRDHVELIRTSSLSIVPILLRESRQITQIVPVNLANLLARPRLEVRIKRHVSEDEHAHVLLSHRDIDILGFLFVFGRKTSSPNIKASLLVHLANCTIQVLLILIDLPTRERPRRAFLPAAHQQNTLHTLIEQDGAAYGHAHLVGQKLFIGCDVLCIGKAAQKRTVLEQGQTKGAQRQTWQWLSLCGGQRTDEVFVVPLRFFDLEAEAWDGGEFRGWEVEEEADGEVVEPCDEC